MRQAAEKARKAADASDVEEIERLEAEADELERKARSLKKADGLDQAADDGKSDNKSIEKPEAGLLRENLKRAGFEDATIAGVLKAVEGSELGGDYSVSNDGEKSFGDFLLAVYNEDKSRLKNVYGSIYAKDLVESSGASGGYTVPTEQMDEVLRVEAGDAIVRPRARVIPMSRRNLTIPALNQSDEPAEYWKLDYYGGVLSYWTEEGGAKTETEPSFRQMELVAHKLAGYTQASDELLSDSATALEVLLSDMFRNTIMMREEFAFFRGSGVGEPEGILECDALLTQDRTTANEINFNDVARMVGLLMPNSLSKAVWVVDQTALPQLIMMQDGAGNNVFVPNQSGGVTQSIPGSILGRPVLVTEKLESLGTTGDFLLADFSYYVIGDRQQTVIASSRDYAFINDLTTWRFTHRVDGQPWLDAPIYIDDDDNQVSPFVALHEDTV